MLLDSVHVRSHIAVARFILHGRFGRFLQVTVEKSGVVTIRSKIGTFQFLNSPRVEVDTKTDCQLLLVLLLDDIEDPIDFFTAKLSPREALDRLMKPRWRCPVHNKIVGRVAMFVHSLTSLASSLDSRAIWLDRS